MTLGAVTVLLIVAITGVVIVVRDRLQSPSPPDLAAAMSSPAVLDRHEAAAAWLMRLSGRVQGDSWLVLQGQDLADDCRVTSINTEGLMVKAALGVLCERRVTRYYAFDGPLRARLDQLKEEFTRSGAVGVSPCAKFGPPGQGQVLQRAICGSFPVPAGLPGPVAFPGAAFTVGYTWLGRSDKLDTQALSPGALPPSSTTPGRERYYVRQEVPAKATIQRGLRAHAYVLVVYYYSGYYYNRA